MSDDIGMSPTGHGEGPPSDTRTGVRSASIPPHGGLGRSVRHCNGRTGDDHEGASDLVEAVDPVAPEDS